MQESDREGGKRRFNRQDLEVRALGGKRQPGFRKDRKEAPGFKETEPCLGGKGGYSGARIVQSAGTKYIHNERPKRAFPWRQRPQFVHQLSKLDPPPSSPWILRAHHNNVLVIVNLFKGQPLICKRADSLCDDEVDVSLAQFKVQSFRLCGHEMKHYARMAAGQVTIRAGKLRALAVTTEERLDLLPNLPTVGEFLPGYEASGWSGLAAPRGTPSEIIERLNGEINAGLADPKLRARFTDLGSTLFAGSPGDLGKHIAEEIEKWGKVIRIANIKPD